MTGAATPKAIRPATRSTKAITRPRSPRSTRRWPERRATRRCTSSGPWCCSRWESTKRRPRALYAVLSVGPGWDWTTMSSLYPSVDVYTKQLRALEDYVQAIRECAGRTFCAGYQYMTEPDTQPPQQRQFEQVVKLAPNDQVSRQLLAMINSPDSSTDVSAGGDSRPLRLPRPTDAQLTAPTNITGAWRATPPTGGGTIDLSLGRDGRFTWKYARPDKTQSFDGKVRSGRHDARARLQQRRHDGRQSECRGGGSLLIQNGRRPAERPGTEFLENSACRYEGIVCATLIFAITVAIPWPHARPVPTAVPNFPPHYLGSTRPLTRRLAGRIAWRSLVPFRGTGESRQDLVRVDDGAVLARVCWSPVSCQETQYQ